MHNVILKVRTLKVTTIYSIIIVAAALVLYRPILSDGFALHKGDDNWMLFENQYVFSLRIDNIADYFSSFYNGQYSPINTLAYGLIYSMMGLKPFWYHMFSILLHVANALLIFEFVKRLLKLSNGGMQLKESIHISFVTSLLFTIHPMQVESVAWISASKVILYSTFFIGALKAYLYYLERGRVMHLIFSIILFLLSFGAKEQAVVFPLCLVLIDFYLKRDFKEIRIWLEKIPFFVLAIGLGCVSLVAQQSGFANMLNNDYYPFFQRLPLAGYAFSEYLFKLLIPFSLAYYYSFPMAPSQILPGIYWIYPFVVGSIVVFSVLTTIDYRRDIVFGLGFFTVNLLLSLHLIPMARGSLMADRYVYLSCIGLFFIIATVILRLLKGNVKLKLVYLSAFFLYAVYLATRTYWYAIYWT